jgi:hypothetical protein
MDTAAYLAITADECERIVAAFEPPVVAAGVSSFEDDYGVSVAPDPPRRQIGGSRF